MLAKPQPPRIPLPKSWPGCVKSAVIHAIALAHYSIVYARAWAADSINARVRLAAEKDRFYEECALLREELRIKDARSVRIPPQRRPHYSPQERMAILELRAARGWSLKQTADTFLVTSFTIASWMKRIDEQGPDALLQLHEPVNKFPDFVRYIVQRLKTLNPSMGKVKIAETLCRAGLHLGVTTVGRILKEDPQPGPEDAALSTRVVTAKQPNHVWHVDLTAVPTSMGFWAPWLPFALPQCWPFCWWVAVVIDHYSRRIMGVATFKNSPTSVSVQHFLEHVIDNAGATSKYLICDKGPQFWCDAFKHWCDQHNIKPRFGAVGQHGSIAIVERFILSLKNECTRVIRVPLHGESFCRERALHAHWFNEERSHSALDGKTPHEVYHDLAPACERPRYEPRARWPRSST
jgi:transposase InsO family protein